MASSTGKIFISYRRDDSASDTGRIYDRLVEEFGRDNIFKDVDSIPLGVDFAQHIDQEVGRCQVLLVVMGKNWLTPRLQNPEDFVRLEIESALKRNIPVVPVFLEGVTAPPPREQLPESLQPLIRRNGTQVGHDPRFHADMGRLVKGIRDYFQQPNRPVQPSPPPATPPTTPTQTVLGGSAPQVNEPTGPVFAGPMSGNTININYADTTAPAPAQPPDLPKPDSSYPRFSFEVVTVNPQGQIVDRRESSAPYQTVDLGQDVTLEMVLIPGGTFQMGQTKAEQAELIRQVGEKDYYQLFAKELPLHPVTLGAFWMGRYPVTQAQWRAVATLPRINQDLDPEPAHFNFNGEQRPVEQVSWHDAIEFCDRLSQKLGQPYTLPSEAQWEYACRAGTTTPFYFGETITTDLANYRGTDWDNQGKTYPGFYGQGPIGEYRELTTSVGSFPPNAFGLYDMHGNVFEWCLDHWHGNYKGVPSDGSARVTGGNSDLRMLRGGSWGYGPWNCRCATRDVNGPSNRYLTYGFRVVSVRPKALGRE